MTDSQPRSDTPSEYFEDIDAGDRREFGSRTITRDEIREFARQYDPQPIHTDEEAAAETMMGGLVASGWHTAAVCMRLLVDHVDDRAFAGARGIDELRWIQPVRPGDTLTVETEVLETYPAENSAEIGYVDERLTGYNQDGDAVISWISLAMVYRREPSDGGERVE
ncbi:MaoC family dehydratase [Halobacteria archaeon AArc-m2/3/4]|uniref:MaoC family dehydratase n=1 Tax=Natronoglomus mannanivorans TaxID=2979990 RepID=A0AAP3E2I9_9EURY|nr:MaoC family dehydratase [Halobacteria archaeon AArc-xg1-1]MCU4974195.1 MaoC family dehydratase [Halobacteria archaeon AArc-m2/3/4]